MHRGAGREGPAGRPRGDHLAHQAAHDLPAFLHRPTGELRDEQSTLPAVLLALGAEDRAIPHHRPGIAVIRADYLRIGREPEYLTHRLRMAEEHGRPDPAQLDREGLAVPLGAFLPELDRLLDPQFDQLPAREIRPRRQAFQERGAYAR